MVARLRGKPGGDQIPVTLGNFADVPVPGTRLGLRALSGRPRGV
jgi:hypothetical protein